MRIFLILPLLLWVQTIHATHVRGGEFRYTHVSGYTYSIEFHFYTRLSAPADRPELIFDFGDGLIDTVLRTSIYDHMSGVACYGDLRYSVYQTNHTYPGPGMYEITMDDPNRNGGIVNIPNSITQSLCVKALLVIDDDLGTNNSVVLNNPQPNILQTGSDLIHHLDPTDVEGDSLSFELVTPLGISCEPIPGYQYPGPDLTIDPLNGTWIWSSPNLIGEYNITIRANEWRNGQMIGQVTRDMTVCVLPLVGMEEYNPSPTFTLSPTLTTGPIRITSDHREQMPLRIFNAAGTLVQEHLVPPGEQVIDITAEPAGLYLFHMNGAAARVVKH